MEVVLSVKSKTDGAEQQLRCAADGGITLGRSPHSPVPLNGTGISRDHVRFEAEGSALSVTDLSSNGTWVSGKRIPRGRPVTLKQDDYVEVPGYEIRIRIPVEIAAPAQRTATAAPPADRAGWLRSSTGLERFIALVALLSVALTLLYYWS
jgi:predicted component of type VI protein secretion system